MVTGLNKRKGVTWPDGTPPHTSGASEVVALRSLIIGGPGKPPDAELRRLIAADALPDVVSAEDAIGGTFVGDRYFDEIRGWRGYIARRLPLIVAQALEVIIRGRQYDAVVTWSDRPAILVGAVMRLWRGRPGHVAILMWPSKPRKAVPLRMVQRGIDKLIVRAPLQRRFVEEHLGIPVERFVDVRTAVDTTFWRPTLGAADMICSVGQEMRDYGTLVEALRPLGIPCHIALGASFGSSQARWCKRLDGQNLPGSVSVGAKSLLELRELYARSRFVVVPLLPSDSNNGITTILEAFAMGRAVICTQTAGQVGILEPGVNSISVPPFDALALRQAIWQLWNDTEKCTRFGAAGRELVTARHGLDQWTEGLMRAVEEAVATRARGRG